MKTPLFALFATVAVMAGTSTARAGTDVGVSIGINQPGVYGRVDIGRVPAPPVYVYPQPLVIAPTPYAVQQRPIYLHVPPGHSRDWRRYCGRYSACGQPVYFVQERWYQDNYARGQWRDDGRRYGRGPDRGWRDHGPDRGDHGRGDRGPGRGDHRDGR